MRRLLLLLALGCADKPVTREEPPRVEAPSTAPAGVSPEPSGLAAPVAEAVPDAGGWLGPDRRERRREVYDRGELPLAAIPREHPSLPFLTPGSVSVGTSSDGYIVQGKVLSLTGDHHYVMTTQAARGTNVATDELVDAIVNAAGRVAERYPGSRLPVGNLARGGGGDIPWSRSHNSGRDADLGFFVTDTAGAPVVLHDLVRLDRKGEGFIAGEPVRFDADRSWTLVKALLQDPTIRLQYLFVSRPLRSRILAAARGERAELIDRAAAVLRQPLGAAPHDDHLHVRIVCPEADLAEGCLDTMELPEGYVPNASVRAESAGRARRLLSDPEAATRRNAAQLLRVLDAREAGDALIPLAGDPDPTVRAEALRALGALEVRAATASIGARLLVEADVTCARLAVEALRAFSDPASARVLAQHVAAPRSLVDADGAQVSLRALAARALRLAPPDRRVLLLLASALEEPDLEVRRALVEALEQATNIRVAAADDPNVRAAWSAWLDREGRKDPETWWRAGFAAAGASLRRFDKRAAAALLGVVQADAPVGLNAIRQLMRITRHDGSSTLAWSRYERWSYWNRWLRRHGYLRRR